MRTPKLVGHTLVPAARTRRITTKHTRVPCLDPPQHVAVQAIVDEAARAINEDGADVICLGCAGMAGVTAAISAKLGVPAVDGVAAAVALAQAVVGLGLSTSKTGVFAPGPDNPRSHWPLSEALGL